MNLKDVLKKAMQGEIEGRELYRTAAEKSEDPKAGEVFSFLADEEDSHLQALQTIYKSYTDDEELKIELPPKKINLDNIDNPIFSENFKTRLKGRHFEMSALSIGIKLELDSYKFYSDLADETYDIKLKEFFKNLSDWEKAHYNALNREFESLQEEYFEKNNFAPF